jgi:hypothetical protein
VCGARWEAAAPVSSEVVYPAVSRKASSMSVYFSDLKAFFPQAHDFRLPLKTTACDSLLSKPLDTFAFHVVPHPSCVQM